MAGTHRVLLPFIFILGVILGSSTVKLYPAQPDSLLRSCNKPKQIRSEYN
jgi:hypothetical protein